MLRTARLLVAACSLLLAGTSARSQGVLAEPPAPKSGPARAGWEIARSGNGHGSTPCSACHGMDGSGRRAAGIPRLAGQEASYLEKQLGDFQSGTRAHFTMQPVARTLSDADVKAVVAWYSSLPAKDVTPSTQVTEVLALGSWMASRGIVEKGVPACNSCHGPDGCGVPPMFPRLMGQSAAYMKKQFNALRTGERQNDPAGMMRGIAARLSPAEMRAAAAWYESLGQQVPPAFATSASLPVPPVSN